MSGPSPGAGTSSIAGRRRRWLLPREHGAYAELLFPLLTGLVKGWPNPTTALFAFAAVSWFLAHEPLAVLRGVRGVRQQTVLADTARDQLALFLTVGVLTGALALATATVAARAAALVPLTGAVVLIPWVLRRRLKTLAAEVLVVAVLSATILPMTVAAGSPWGFGWTAGGVWFGSFTVGTLAVHAIKIRHKGTTEGRWSLLFAPALAIAGVGIGVGAAGWGIISAAHGAALAIPAALAGILSVLPIHPKRLKRVGWSLVAANVLTLVLLLLG